MWPQAPHGSVMLAVCSVLVLEVMPEESGFVSSHWKLYPGQDVVRAKDSGQKMEWEEDWHGADDAIMSIVMGSLTKTLSSELKPCPSCIQRTPSGMLLQQGRSKQTPLGLLTCGTPVNETAYDALDGVSCRHLLSFRPDADAAVLILPSNGGSMDINVLEWELREALEQSDPDLRSQVLLHKKIGNYWRVKGNAYHAIECFRKALAASPQHPDVLQDLARLLFSHGFLEDAIMLTWRSLELQPPQCSVWYQHFSLGEMLKAAGDEAGAAAHFHQAVDLNPGLQEAARELADLQKGSVCSSTSLTLQTATLISTLVVVVLLLLHHKLLSDGSKDSGPRDLVAQGAPCPTAAQVLRKPPRHMDCNPNRIAAASRVIRFKKVNHS
uniref:uncharacterized protein isoform X2 n=1 Tax=Myxine glutinosa TaxID=7769 RepID=UPI0035902704